MASQKSSIAAVVATAEPDAQAAPETGLGRFPEDCPWDLAGAVLAEGWLPQL